MGPRAEPWRMGWELKLLGSFWASRAKALCTSGTPGLASSTWAPQLSKSEKDPTKAKALGRYDSVSALFWPQSNWSSAAARVSLRPETPPRLFWYCKKASVPLTAPAKRPGTGPVRIEMFASVMELGVTPTSVAPPLPPAGTALAVAPAAADAPAGVAADAEPPPAAPGAPAAVACPGPMDPA